METRFSLRSFSEAICRSKREAALLAAAAVLLLALTGFSFWLTQRGFRDAEIADRLNRFNARLAEFVQMLRTAESSQRGFVLTGVPQFLRPYSRMSPRLMQLARDLQMTAPKELAAAKRFEAIFPPLSAKLKEMAETIDHVNEGRKDLAIERVKDGFGLNLTTTIEADVEAMEKAANALIQSNEARTRQLQTFKSVVDGVGAALILAFSCSALWLLLRSSEALRRAQKKLSTANVELEDIVSRRTAELRRANEEIQRFAYIVSHDLRSPLVNIMGFTSELERLRDELFERLREAEKLTDAETLNKDFDEAFAFIKSSISRMDRLIGAILRISREGKRPLNPELIDTNALVRVLVEGVAHQIRERNVTVDIGTLPPVVTDRLALEQILSNLIENAIKFSKPSTHAEVKVDGKARGADIVFTVSDNGRGIDAKDHQRIFELFRRAGPQDEPGEGMGLAYVSALVRRLGGTVTVESELGRGSAFIVMLPNTLAQEVRKAA